MKTLDINLMRTYNININSNKRAIAAFILLFPTAIHLTTYIPDYWHDVPYYILFFIILIGAAYSVTLISRGRIKIELSKQGIKTVWVKRLILSQGPNVELSWDDIIDFVHQEDRWLDSFRLKLTNNLQFKFYRYSIFPQKDDFSKFLTQFPKFLTKINTSKEAPIERGKTAFQTKSFKWVLIGLTIGTLGLIVNKIVNPDSGTGWPALGVIITGILFYWNQVGTEQKDN